MKYRVKLYYKGNKIERIVKAKSIEEAEKKIYNRYSVCRITSIEKVEE